MERTSKMERILFKAVRILMLVTALLSLLAAIGLGINGLVKSGASANETIKAPTISFEAYTNQLAEEKTARDNAEKTAEEKRATDGAFPAPQNPEQKMEPEQFPSQYRDTLNELEKLITNYAQKTGQPAPTEMLRGNLYLEASGRFSEFGLIDDFFAKLVQLCKSLEAAGDDLRALDDTDPRRIFWGKFLDYAYDRYQADLSQQVRAINNARQEARETRMLASAEFMKAGICAGAFFVLTLLLVLLNIEKNTYMTSVVLRSAYPDTYNGSSPLFKKRSSAAPQSENTGKAAS